MVVSADEAGVECPRPRRWYSSPSGRTDDSGESFSKRKSNLHAGGKPQASPFGNVQLIEFGLRFHDGDMVFGQKGAPPMSEMICGFMTQDLKVLIRCKHFIQEDMVELANRIPSL